ncbi:hypothetical protein Tdes44962_MAKER05728 [Teratosphaeria destructans]|uniref:BZIP transcription factor n=1 Tax=Teratosphaeria destructans TaxID=418781 RepID=A0A9W7SJ63_9PEZI|nr:hypothetical protein Tdes44962_MAKER05728 [Teratosphaeria destructans]
MSTAATAHSPNGATAVNAPSAFSPHGNAYSHDAQATAVAALGGSPAPTQNGNPPPPNGRKRKATGAPGSRGVANLTPEQLAKKRANDREAQRAIRERTKQTIENLEARIRDLESQQPYQELQRVEAERDRALRENEDLRTKLNQIAGVLGPQAAGAICGGGAFGTGPVQPGPGALNGTFELDDLIDPTWLTQEPGTELAALTAQQQPLPPLSHHHQPQQSHHAYYTTVPAAQMEPQIHPDLRSPTHSHSAASSQPGEQSWRPARSPSGQYASQHNSVAYDHQPPPGEQQTTQSNGERPAAGTMGLNFVLDSTQKRSPPEQTATPAATASPSNPTTPLYARLPINSEPTCGLDDLLGDFIKRSRERIEGGEAKADVLGPEYPSFMALQDPQTTLEHLHPVSGLLIAILSKFPDISALPEKVAVLYVMFLLMRWSIDPCEDNYNRLPEWMRPVADQLETPHPAWIDNLPWSVPASEEFDFNAFISPDSFCRSDSTLSGSTLQMSASNNSSSISEVGSTFANTFIRPFMRSRLVNGASDVKFDDFFVPYTTTVSINWPYEQNQVLVHNGSLKSDRVASINDAFETHLRRLENWSLGKKFQEVFPQLVDESIRIAGSVGGS